jgi:chromosome segregation ATPase
VRELEFQINSIIEENRRLKTNLDEWRVKIVELDEVKNHGERVKRSANQDKAFFESEIVRLKKQIEELLSRGPQIVEKVIEKRVEVPVDVYREKVIVDDSKVVQLSYEIERLKQVINLRQKELEDWRSKYSSLEIKISESRGKESRIFEIENRVTLLTSEIERLNVFNAKLKSDNNELYIKLSNVEGENVRHERVKQSSMQDKSMYESKIVSLANEVERLNSMVFELRGKESRLTEYENKIVMMASECERLNALVRKIKEENEGLNIKIIQFGGSDSRHLELENRISMMASENERLNGFIKKLKEENEGINARFIQLRGSGDKFENLEKVVMLSTEIERLNIIIRQYKTENERLNVMFVEFKNNEGKFCEYEEKIASEMERLRK